MNTDEIFLSPLVAPYDIERPVDWIGQFRRLAPLEVEIGFGLGEVLIRSAGSRRDTDFIGIEQNWERIHRTLKTIDRQRSPDAPLNNLKILRIDARAAFERLFKEKSIARIIALFPCPWPKKGHVKHRIFSNNFLRLLNSRLQDKGTLEIVTDHRPYFEWICEQAQGAGFLFSTGCIGPRFDTKFERKWQAKGQNEFYKIDFQKKKHCKIAVKKDIGLKTYRLDEFAPHRLKLKDEKGKVAIIFKDKLFDPDKQVMVIYAIVTEEHLLQHVRIVIAWAKTFWHIGKAEGQVFFPTKGVARAIELVYECAKASV